MTMIATKTPPMRTAELFDFVRERHQVYLRKEAGAPKPWTSDPILQVWRFCNVYRELDTVTKWIAENWREPYRDHPYLYFAMDVARLVNRAETLAELGFPIPWDPAHFVRVLEGRQRRGEKVFTGAYMIHADRHFQGSKAAYLAAEVLTPLWEDRSTLRRALGGTNKARHYRTVTLAEAHRALTAYRDMGGFIAAQVLADLKYVEPLLNAPDWWTWAASGPGSRRGLNRVLGRPTNAKWAEPEWLQSLQALHREINPLVEAARMPKMHAQDLQNCLCEADKWWRVRLGEGKPKARYPGRA
jgi:hypothetical protein